MNKRILAVALALLVFGVANAQTKKGKAAEAASVADEWNDIEVFEQHKLYPRANVVSYGNEDDIEKNG